MLRQLPISTLFPYTTLFRSPKAHRRRAHHSTVPTDRGPRCRCPTGCPRGGGRGDRKSTRLNSSHVSISYAVFCLKKKKNYSQITLMILWSTLYSTETILYDW